MNTINTPHRNHGFTILISVLVLSAVALSVGVSLMFFGTKSLQTTGAIQSSARASSLAQACVEDAFEKIRSSGGQVSSWSLTLANYSCTYTVANLGGEKRLIESTSTVDDSFKKIVVDIESFSDVFVFNSWTEQ